MAIKNRKRKVSNVHGPKSIKVPKFKSVKGKSKLNKTDLTSIVDYEAGGQLEVGESFTRTFYNSDRTACVVIKYTMGEDGKLTQEIIGGEEW